jgi:hypothetical protein
MSLSSRHVAPLFVAVTAAGIAMASIAAADPALPGAGAEDAGSTISAYESAGYDVQINYDNGVPDVDLGQCWVNSVNTSDATAGGLKTVYIDVECPK